MMENKKELVISLLELRRIIGTFAMGLPFIVAGGAWIVFSVGVQESISSYYYTPMRDVLVGLVFFLAGFFWSYRGYDIRDRIAGKLVVLFGWLFAISPPAKTMADLDLSGTLHLAFAAAFFVVLIYFSGFLFTQTDPDKPPTPQKLRRNFVYRVCAVVMGAALGLGVIFFYVPAVNPLRPVFWGEALAIEAFGVSWFVKGEGILKDGEKMG